MIASKVKDFYRGRETTLKTGRFDVGFGIMNKGLEIFFSIRNEKPRLIFYPSVGFKYACALVNRPIIDTLRDFKPFVFSKDAGKFSKELAETVNTLSTKGKVVTVCVDGKAHDSH